MGYFDHQFFGGASRPQNGGRFRALKLPSTGSWGATQLTNIPRTTTAPSRTIGINGRRRAVRRQPISRAKGGVAVTRVRSAATSVDDS